MARLTFRLDEIANRLHGRLYGRATAQVRGLAYDSRRCPRGALFAALKGERADGHDYAAEAIANGACAVLVERKVALGPEAGMVIVECVEEAVRELGIMAREAFRGTVVGVVGSTGKTTTKDFTASLLAEQGVVDSTPGNRNNLLGLPETLMEADTDADFWVLELGISRPGEMELLAPIARPTTVVFTNIRPVHTEFFPSLEAILEEKAKVLRFTRGERRLILNGDDSLLAQMDLPPGFETVTYGKGKENDVVVSAGSSTSPEGVPFVISAGAKRAEGTLGVPGLFNLENFAAAAATAISSGLAVERAASAAATLRTGAHRSITRKLSGDVLLLDDSYNSNPAAMASVIAETSRWKRRVVAALGEMLELGEISAEKHAEIGRLCAESGVAALLAVGGSVAGEMADAFRASGRPCLFVKDWREGVEWFYELIKGGDCVLVKGSRGIGLDGLVEWLLERRRG